MRTGLCTLGEESISGTPGVQDLFSSVLLRPRAPELLASAFDFLEAEDKMWSETDLEKTKSKRRCQWYANQYNHRQAERSFSTLVPRRVQSAGR